MSVMSDSSKRMLQILKLYYDPEKEVWVEQSPGGRGSGGFLRSFKSAISATLPRLQLSAENKPLPRRLRSQARLSLNQRMLVSVLPPGERGATPPLHAVLKLQLYCHPDMESCCLAAVARGKSVPLYLRGAMNAAAAQRAQTLPSIRLGPDPSTSLTVPGLIMPEEEPIPLGSPLLVSWSWWNIAQAVSPPHHPRSYFKTIRCFKID